jgi:pimeloyl-ACP methyl ester carboxylesterase
MGAMAMDRLMGVAFNDIGPEIDPEGLAVINDYLGRPPAWKTIASATEKRAAAMKGFIGVPEARWREEAEKLYRQTDKGLALTYDPKLRDAVIGARVEDFPDLWPFYKAFENVPVAVIWGEHSNILNAETFQKMGTALPHAIMAKVKDRGHIPFLDEPESLDALRSWIAQMAAR